MSENTQVVESLSDDQILENSQRIRKQIVDKIVEKDIPTDADTQYVLLSALKDMDKQVIDKKRVAIEDKNSNVASVVAAAVLKISNLMDGADPFKRQSAGLLPQTEIDRLPGYEALPGELEVGVTNQTYDDFMSVNGKGANRNTGIESE